MSIMAPSARLPGTGSVRGPFGAVTQCEAATKHACNKQAMQAPVASPTSDASCAMSYGSCSLPGTPAAQEPQQKLAAAPAGGEAPGAAVDGWFAKCRGCGCMTAHEQFIQHSNVPFCRRCQHTLHTACPAMQEKMVATLLYVHAAWSNAGL